MTKKELLDSGLLESYLTGDLSINERSIVEKFLSDDIDVQKEYDRLQSILSDLTFEQGLKPNPKVREKLLANTRNKEVKIRNLSWIWKAASISIIVGTSVLALYFYGEWKNALQQNALLLSERTQIAENLNQVKSEKEIIDQRNDIAFSANYERVVLNGTGNAPDKQAVVFWEKSTSKVYVFAGNLSSLDPDQQYQLWALVDGQPVDAGVFNSGDFTPMKEIGAADSFAVTIEQKGGSPTPTLSTMQVFGSIS